MLAVVVLVYYLRQKKVMPSTAFVCLAKAATSHCQHIFVVWKTAPLHLGDYLRLICFLSTSVYSALGVSAITRYINRRFTYLLTYLLYQDYA